MLQQTTVATVRPYFERFVARWPDVAALAAASLDEILQEWQGLGYYARARNLHACARAVAGRHGRAFPSEPAALRRFRGSATTPRRRSRRSHSIGRQQRSTAMSSASSPGFSPLPNRCRRQNRACKALAAALVPARRAGDFAQAMMDLGATICTPRRPRCVLCPWRGACAAAARGIADDVPARAARPERPVRYGVAFWLTRPDGAVLLRRRPENGLLGGMIEIPSTAWRAQPWELAEAIGAAPAPTQWSPFPGNVRHGFTHFQLELAVVGGQAESVVEGLWSPVDKLGEHALPTLMKKTARHAISALALAADERASSNGNSPASASRTGAKERR